MTLCSKFGWKMEKGLEGPKLLDLSLSLKGYRSAKNGQIIKFYPILETLRHTGVVPSANSKNLLHTASQNFAKLILLHRPNFKA